MLGSWTAATNARWSSWDGNEGVRLAVVRLVSRHACLCRAAFVTAVRRGRPPHRRRPPLPFVPSLLSVPRPSDAWLSAAPAASISRLSTAPVTVPHPVERPSAPRAPVRRTRARGLSSQLSAALVNLDSGARLHTLMQGLCGLQQNDLSVDDYYTAFDRLMGPVCSMVPKSADECADCANKDKFFDKFFMYQFVMGVRSEFESVRAQLLNNPATPSIHDALSALLAEETRLHSLSPAAVLVIPSHSVLLASHRHGSTLGSSSETKPCEHCGKTTHRVENCFSRHPEKLAEFRARRAARGRGSSERGCDWDWQSP
ncbi:hypothetical protein U9M48_031929 [Paspalum notatum var. saurae]|uniref:Retrotransposon gag domain-containing protein n=1 Tax=Paspalum notatum var. saurae TaxID=547442 RepID=A0AAQ3U4Y0_PASNO